MVLILLEYTYESKTRSFVFDVNNPDQLDSIRRKLIWAAKTGVEVHIKPTATAVIHPNVSHAA